MFLPAAYATVGGAFEIHDVRRSEEPSFVALVLNANGNRVFSRHEPTPSGIT